MLKSMNLAPAHMSQSVLSENGIDCTIVSLAPHQSRSLVDWATDQEHVLFALEGGVAVTVEDTTVLLRKDHALRIGPGKSTTLISEGERPAKLLRIDLAHRKIVELPLFAFPVPESFAVQQSNANR